jgi:uncharacterized membrane protein YgdD (TMEM256/DUF423 family)
VPRDREVPADVTRTFFVLGALSAGVAVILGAFGAHWLRGRLTADMLAVFEVGVRYQMYHALALLAVAWAYARWPGTAMAVAGWLFVVGAVVFSGTLYLLAFTGQKWLGAITPLGGVALILGWIALAWGACFAR